MSEPELPIVELHPAYWFTCDECGTDVFVRTIAEEATDEQAIEIREAFGVEEWERGVCHWVPSKVHCTYCNATFNTDVQLTGDDGDEEE